MCKFQEPCHKIVKHTDFIGPRIYVWTLNRPFYDHICLVNTETVLMFSFPGGSEVKASASNTGDLGSIPGSGRSPRERNGNPLQYSCLENLMDGGAWWATVHGVAKSRTRLSDFTFNLKICLFGCYSLLPAQTL